MISRKAVVLSATVIAIVAATLTGVHAHKGASGIVMQRMMSMKSMGQGMKTLAAMVTGKTQYDAGKARAVASEIKKHAISIPSQFPKGTIEGPTEALPAIWKDWDGFKRHADKLAELADQLEVSADNGKIATLGLFAKMGRTCSGCHQDYRKKKN